MPLFPPFSIKPVQSIAGTTAGTARLYQTAIGPFNFMLLHFDGYRNASATEQFLGVPQATGQRTLAVSGNGKITSIWRASSQLTAQMNVVTTLASTGGTVTNVDTIPGKSFGEIIDSSGFDQFGLGTNQASAATAIYFFVGLL
jgi:hypothetical protein